jgi:hypothetical protein
MLRVWVKNGANRTVIPTRITTPPSSATSCATRRASAATCSSSPARSATFCWNVISAA